MDRLPLHRKHNFSFPSGYAKLGREAGGHLDQAHPYLRESGPMSTSLNGTNGPIVSAALASGNIRDPADVQMDQIRDLLLGQFKTELSGRFAAIESRLSTLEQHVAAARHEPEAKRKASLDELAKGVATLGEHIRQMART
jgi:hypothetical protein